MSNKVVTPVHVSELEDGDLGFVTYYRNSEAPPTFRGQEEAGAVGSIVQRYGKHLVALGQPWARGWDNIFPFDTEEKRKKFHMEVKRIKFHGPTFENEEDQAVADEVYKKQEANKDDKNEHKEEGTPGKAAFEKVLDQIMGHIMNQTRPEGTRNETGEACRRHTAY